MPALRPPSVLLGRGTLSHTEAGRGPIRGSYTGSWLVGGGCGRASSGPQLPRKPSSAPALCGRVRRRPGCGEGGGA